VTEKQRCGNERDHQHHQRRTDGHFLPISFASAADGRLAPGHARLNSTFTPKTVRENALHRSPHETTGIDRSPFIENFAMSELGLVSRVTPVHTAMRNCTGDEGRPFEVGNQVLISSHRKLLWSKAMVVSVAEKSEQDSGRHD